MKLLNKQEGPQKEQRNLKVNALETGQAGKAVGPEVIRAALLTLPTSPGIYRMLDSEGTVLYIGKARNLRRRVANYTKPAQQTARIRMLIYATAELDITTTRTEVEALLLESNLIKRQRPRYNILLRDDKSFPYIMIRKDHKWAQIAKHRGKQVPTVEYFGPFASASAVNRALSALQKAFPLRSCSDLVFKTRTRPCLQFQIKRCTAPCVGRIEEIDYEEIVREARNFLKGRSSSIQKKLSDHMNKAADNREYETAAAYRDRLRALTYIQSHQDINTDAVKDADIIGVYLEANHACVHLSVFRNGQNYGNRSYFPVHVKEANESEVISAFIGQFYVNHEAPKLILISHPISDKSVLEKAISTRMQFNVNLQNPHRGTKAQLTKHSIEHAKGALQRRLASDSSQRKLLEGLAKMFELEEPPARIEVYDNSHISGSNAVGVMIVAGPEGWMRKSYRKFNIRSDDLTPGDDYAMMKQMVIRRFTRLLKEEQKPSSENWPDLVLIDGGKGHLTAVNEVLEQLGVENIALAGIAKGKKRDSRTERLFLTNGQVKTLSGHNPILYFLQRLRDEAHRFAITAHRARRSKDIKRSPLDQVAGVGRRRKAALLNHFGSSVEVSRAGLSDLERVEGISKHLAQKIYEYFHAKN